MAVEVEAEDTEKGGEVRLEWNATTDYSTPIKYNIYMSTTEGNVFVAAPIDTTQGTVFYVEELTNDDTYYFGVRAQDDEGNEDDNDKEVEVVPTDNQNPTWPDNMGTKAVEDMEYGDGNTYFNRLTVALNVFLREGADLRIGTMDVPEQYQA